MPKNKATEAASEVNSVTPSIYELYKLFHTEKAPVLIGPANERIPIPDEVFSVLRQVIGYMMQGKSVSIVPVMEELTTQAAANMLGVSRPFLVNLLNSKVIPFHKAGTHRRIFLKDVLDYRQKRDADRKAILAELAREAVAAGDYDTFYVPEAGE